MPRALWNGRVIAETATVETVEGNLYFPPAALNMEHFLPSDLTSVCPWKGTVRYADVVVDGNINAGAAWYYPDPKSAAVNIKWPPPVLRIGEAGLIDGGKISIIDEAMSPPMASTVFVDALTIRNIDTTEPSSRADLTMKARVDRSELTVDGWATGFKAKPDFEFRANLSELELPTVSPYVARCKRVCGESAAGLRKRVDLILRAAYQWRMQQSPVPFLKMHGLGNDFVIVDARAFPFQPTDVQARAIADRRLGVGCDQLILIEPAQTSRADAFMRIYNADGGEVAACGNATRCVAAMVMGEKKRSRTTIETRAGLLSCEQASDGRITVDMGPISHDWQKIPLARATNTLHLPIAAGPVADGVAVNVGNPHAVFFVIDADAVPMEEIGPEIENHPLFPERTNVGVVEVLDRTRLRVRVWERGTGVTHACGTGACAAVAAAHARELCGRVAEVVLDGGVLQIALDSRGHARMTGPVALSFTGVIYPSLVA